MEDKIEVGEYGRTNLGNIIIFAWLENTNGVRYENKVILIKDGRVTNEFYYFKENEKIVKHSKNITDLIEVGDIVILEDEFDKSIYYMYDEDFVEATKQDVKEGETLKSILTREEFEKRKYKI